MTMSRNRLQTLVLALALVAAVVYYRRREQTIRESLTLSQQWAAPQEGHTPESVATTDPSALERAATLLNARPEEVPDRVESLDTKVRELTSTLDKNRSAWVARWWSARRSEPPATDEPHVTVIDLPDGSLEDAEALAKAALSDALGVTIVTASGDGSLAVAVGSDLDQRADELAREVAQAAGGGAGGGAEFATGGGEAEKLAAAAQDVRDRLGAEAGFAV
jgi:alanyl-tRNA synthetase